MWKMRLLVLLEPLRWELREEWLLTLGPLGSTYWSVEDGHLIPRIRSRSLIFGLKEFEPLVCLSRFGLRSSCSCHLLAKYVDGQAPSCCNSVIRQRQFNIMSLRVKGPIDNLPELVSRLCCHCLVPSVCNFLFIYDGGVWANFHQVMWGLDVLLQVSTSKINLQFSQLTTHNLDKVQYQIKKCHQSGFWLVS